MEQESWLSNSADEPTSRSGPGLSDASILSSITLALASSDGHLVSRTGQLEGLVPHGEVLRTNSRLDAIRTDEVHEASSSTDGPASPVKRGRGRPKGSLDRNPRARKDSRAAGADNANISEENNAHSSATAGDTLDPQGNPIVKRKRGRPRKERTSEPTASREPNAGGTETVPAKAKSAGASHKPAVSYPITPERKEANRKAALRSRLRKVERATILEKMAAGLTEENVALKEKIQALNTLGFDEMAFQEETYPAAEVLRPTGYPGDPPSDVTLGLTPDTGQQKAETLSIAPARDTSDFAEHIRQERRIPSLRALLPSSANALQSDLERRLQDQIDRLRSALDSETEWSLPSASSSSKPKQDIVLLRDVAARLRGENKKATQVVRERRDELLLLNQNGQRTYQREEAETIVDGEAHRENALRQHSEVEAALADMKRHLGQLMTHYELAPVDVKESQFFTLPEKFLPIPLPQPMKRGRPSKPPTNQSEAEPPAKKPRRKSAAPPKADKVPLPKRPEQVRRYRVDGDPVNIYIEKRQAIPGSAEDQVVEVTSRKVYNPRAQ